MESLKCLEQKLSWEQNSLERIEKDIRDVIARSANEDMYDIGMNINNLENLKQEYMKKKAYMEGLQYAIDCVRSFL